MVNLKQEQKKFAEYLVKKAEERGYNVKNKAYIELTWPRYKGDYTVKITLEERGLGFIYVDITYSCHTRRMEVTTLPYGNLFSMEMGIEESIMEDVECGIVQKIEMFEEKNV